MTDFYVRAVREFCAVLLGGVTNRQAYDGCRLLHRDDLAGHWEAVTVLDAVATVARDGIDAGHPFTRLDAGDVNARLLDDGHLKNGDLRAFWLDVNSPADGHDYRLGVQRLRELAPRITEGNFRRLHADTYRGEDSWTAPLDELTERMDRARADMLAVYGRIRRPAGLTVAGGAA